MAETTGRCESCGEAMVLRRANQKRCSTCRLLKDVGWHDGRTAECRTCGLPFIRWVRGKGYDSCGWCMIVRQPEGPADSVRGTCGHAATGTCHSDTPAVLYSDRVALCLPCLTDPEKFKLNQHAMMRKARELTAARSRGTVEVGQTAPTGAEQESG